MISPTLFNRICPQCDKIIIYKDKYKLARALEDGKPCRPCSITNTNKSTSRKKETNAAWKGYKSVGYKWFSKYFERHNKKRTGTITIEDAYNKLEAQGFKCALSGIPLEWSEASGMSIDRINSKLEYTLDNIQLVHKDVNLMKNHFDQGYFIEVCKRIINNMENKND